MKTWETICNIEKNNKLDTIFSRKEPSLVDDALLDLLSSLFLSRGRLQALPSVLACVHGSTYPPVFVPSPLPLCFFVRYTSSFVMHPGSGLCFFHDRRLNHTIRPSTAAPPSLPPSPAYTPDALSTHTSFRLQCHLPPRTHRIA